MGYWVASEFSAQLPQAVLGQPLITASSSPLNLTEVQGIINQYSAEFDGAAAHSGYLVPIPSNASVAGFLVAQLTVYNGARAQVMTTIGGAQDITLAAQYRAAYERTIDQILRGVTPLIGVDADTSEAGRALPRSGGIASPIIGASWVP